MCKSIKQTTEHNEWLWIYVFIWYIKMFWKKGHCCVFNRAPWQQFACFYLINVNLTLSRNLLLTDSRGLWHPLSHEKWYQDKPWTILLIQDSQYFPKNSKNKELKVHKAFDLLLIVVLWVNNVLGLLYLSSFVSLWQNTFLEYDSLKLSFVHLLISPVLLASHEDIIMGGKKFRFDWTIF